MDKIVPEDYLKLKRVNDINVSNNYVAWVESEPAPADQTYTSSIKVLNLLNNSIIQFTSGLKKDYHPRFSPDGKKLAFISTRAEKTQIHIIAMNGGESRKITKAKNGILGFSWAPNSKQLIFTSMVDPNLNEEIDDEEMHLTKHDVEQIKAKRKEEERLKKDPLIITTLTYRRETSYDHPDRFAHIFIIDILTKKTKRVSDGYYHHSVPKFISDNEVVSISSRDLPRDLSTRASLLKFNIQDTSEGELITKIDTMFESSPVAGTNGVLFVNCLGPGNFAGQNSKWAQIIKNDTEIINLDLDRSINQLRILDAKTILVSVNDRGYTDIRKYDINKKEYTKLIEEKISVVDFDAKINDEIYLTATDPIHVWAIWKWSSSNGLELIEDPNQEMLKEKKIKEPDEFWLENPDGIKFQGWFFDAGIQGENKPPLVLSIHGGPHVMWNNAGTMWHEWQCFISEGYSILAINPIGSDGYSEEFSQTITAKWGVEDSRDLLQVVDHYLDKVNPDRLYLTGGSYAGFQTANIIARDHRFKAACSQRGVYDLITFGFNTDIPKFIEWEWEGTPWDKLEYLWEHSPVGRAKDIMTPLMIIHSENDYRVSISQAEELFAALKLQDKEAVFIRYPRDGHELSRSGEPIHVVDRINRMIDWFESHP